jgi:hypothetical protein
MSIREKGAYRGIDINQDTAVLGDNYYLSNGQGCGTIWFKNGVEAKKFIDKYLSIIKLDFYGDVCKLIPETLCKKCRGHYQHNSKEWKKYPDFNCKSFGEAMVNSLRRD